MKRNALHRCCLVLSLFAAMTCFGSGRLAAQNFGGQQNANNTRAQQNLLRFKQLVAQRLGDKEDGFFVIAFSSTRFEMADRTNTRMVPRLAIDVYKVETRSAAVTSIVNHMSGGAPTNTRTPSKRDWRFIGRFETAEEADVVVQKAKLKFNPQPVGRGTLRPQ